MRNNSENSKSTPNPKADSLRQERLKFALKRNLLRRKGKVVDRESQKRGKSDQSR